jgi:hypothetical protein
MTTAALCVPTIHESAFVDIRQIDATVQKEGLVGHVAYLIPLQAIKLKILKWNEAG